MDTGDLLVRLTEATGVSGHELAIRDVVRDVWAPYVDKIREDALGNLIAHRRGTPGADPDSGAAPDGVPSVALAGHQDEIGLMVTAIEDGGFLRFTTVGGWPSR